MKESDLFGSWFFKFTIQDQVAPLIWASDSVVLAGKVKILYWTSHSEKVDMLMKSLMGSRMQRNSDSLGPTRFFSCDRQENGEEDTLWVFLTNGSLLKRSQQLELEVQSRSTTWWHIPKYLNHHCCLTRSTSAGIWNWDLEADTE